jgi:hypothetical protein
MPADSPNPIRAAIGSVTDGTMAGTIEKVERMIAHYNPQVMVLEDTGSKGSRRSPRIRALAKLLLAVAKSRTIKVDLFSQKQVRRVFFGFIRRV